MPLNIKHQSFIYAYTIQCIYNTVRCILALVLTLSRQCLSIGGCYHAEFFGRTEASAIEENWQVNNVPHVVVSVDVGVSQHTVEVVVDSFDDNMGVTSKDGDKSACGEEYPLLKRERSHKLRM